MTKRSDRANRDRIARARLMAGSRISRACDAFDFDADAVRAMFKAAGVDPADEIATFTLGDLQHALEGKDHHAGVSLLQLLDRDRIAEAIIPGAMETLSEYFD